MKFKMPAYELPAADLAERSFIPVGNETISVYSWGAGTPVLFIHGWAGRGTQVSFFIDDLISRGFRVISFDAPAHGNSTGKQTNVLQFANTIFQLERTFGPFSAAISHSFGGMALAYALANGLKLKKAICICPPSHDKIIIDNFRVMLNIPEKVMQHMLESVSTHFGEDIYSRISTINNVSKLTSINGMVIHDIDDDEIPVQAGEAVASAWANAKFIITRGLGHRRILRDQDVIKNCIDYLLE